MALIPPAGRVLALDWGTTRIGVAVSDETQLVATPLEVLRRRAGKRFPLGTFLTLIEREHPVGLVVGLPLDDDGREGDAARAARQLGVQCAERTALPLAFVDESFTTAEAQDALIAAGQAPRRHAARIDALAAATLLQRWLDARRDGAAH
jgi:putative pre-16S rRNA nuclease